MNSCLNIRGPPGPPGTQGTNAITGVSMDIVAVGDPITSYTLTITLQTPNGPITSTLPNIPPFLN